ncbi:MAG: hypothetical protein HYX71_06305 [Opitutae bacterium]|nr:hypothetical protein [Opitutae bacterium]
MKKYIIILVGLVLIGVIIWLGISRYNLSPPLASRSTVSNSQLSDKTNTGAQQNSSTKQNPTVSDEDKALDAAYRARRQRERQALADKDERDFNTPITFYGIVLDEKDLQVSAPTVLYASIDGSFDGERKLQGDQGGRFTISGIRGKYLDVKVAHPGYYEIGESRRRFTYASNDRGPDFKPDPAKSEIFRLRKKGEAAELVREDERVLFTKEDGHARSFSLYDHSRRRDQPDYVILQGVDTAELDRQGKPVRRLEMVVPKGGIQQRTDPFAFVAPSDGYQSSMYYMRIPGQPLDYFVKFDNGNYGRFTIMGSGGEYWIESYLNPDQSPNLEYDPAKEITVIRNGLMGIDLLYPASDDPNKPTPKSTPSKPVERPGGTLIERRRNAAPPPAPPRS